MTGLAIGAKRAAGLTPGELLDGKYRITREIGRGAMGVVYEAMHAALGRRVAVKTLLEEMSANAQLGERFEREARAASAIGHPHIVDVFDLGRTQDGLLFMVMELLDGESLADTLKKTPRLPIPLATHLMVQVLSGLSAAHKHGIVHRDLKPDNIFVLNSEERPSFVKIVDFGISKVLLPQVPGAATAKGSGTMVGSILGTPLYMSPEQAIGQVASIDHRSDIYSAGVVLYEMLCGQTPFVGEGYAQILGSLLEGKYPPPRSLRPEISPSLETAIMRALDRDIDKRFPSATSMRDAIAGGSAEVTPSPILLAASVGDPLHLSLGHLEDPPAPGSASIALLEEPAPPVPSTQRRPTSVADPFAPPPGSETSPLLADDLDRPLALRQTPGRRPPPSEPRAEPREIVVEDSARPRGAARGKQTMAPERLLSSRARSRLVKALSLLAVAVVARVAYSYFRHDANGDPSMRHGAIHKVRLTVEPSQASVQIDHVPATQRELSLDSGAPHVLNAAAPGRVTKRFAFDAKPGLELSVHLGHSLPLPSPTDPPPLPAELAADYPDDPRPRVDIERAFAKLERYADCLALAGDAGGESKEGKKAGARVRLRGEELALCQRLVAEANAAEPAMPELQTAAESYLSATQGGQKLDALARLATTFRAELLAARAAWQLEELSRQGKDEGQKAAWHMRRVALAAQAWLRALKVQGPVSEEHAAKLRDYHQALLEYAQSAGPEMARITGGTDFLQSAEGVVALARGKRPGEFAALDAARRLLSAFDALVLE